MSLRSWLRRWLLGFDVRAVRAAINEQGPAEVMPVEYRYRSIESLLARPTVQPDRSQFVRPESDSLEAVAAYLRTEWPHAWGRDQESTVDLIAGILRGVRVDVERGERV